MSLTNQRIPARDLDESESWAYDHHQILMSEGVSYVEAFVMTRSAWPLLPDEFYQWLWGPGEVPALDDA